MINSFFCSFAVRKKFFCRLSKTYMEQQKEIVYSRDVIEFVTVSTEFCAYLENSESRKRAEFTGTVLKILPLLYLKGSLLPHIDSEEDFLQEEFVTEQDYEWIRITLSEVMGDCDDYLDFETSEVRFNDEAVVKTVSEDLADIYQAVRNFVCAYRTGLDETMYEAVGAVYEAFELYWGQTLTRTMSALHRICYGARSDEEDDNSVWTEDEDHDCGCSHRHGHSHECTCGRHFSHEVE